MSIQTKIGGVWEPTDGADELYVKEAGAWTELCEGYVKEGGAWTPFFYCIETFTLNSAEDVNLASWLFSQGASAGRKIIVNIPQGAIIGGTDAAQAAIVVGNLDRYESVTVNLHGEVQGYGGVVGGEAGRLNGGRAWQGGSAMTLHIHPTGHVRGGGGAGGNGGKGGRGSWIKTGGSSGYGSWWPERLSDYDLGKSYWQESKCSGPGGEHPEDTYCRWINHAAGHACYNPYLYDEDKNPDRDIVWTKASPSDNPGGDFPGTRWAHIKGAYVSERGAGNGGQGGDGQGYQQARQNGTAGAAGRDRAGNGGAGGNGGAWGVNGNPGGQGGTGRYFRKKSLTLSNRWQADRRDAAGANGTGGGTAGAAIAHFGLTIVDDTAGAGIDGTVTV